MTSSREERTVYVTLLDEYKDRLKVAEKPIEITFLKKEVKKLTNKVKKMYREVTRTVGHIHTVDSTSIPPEA